MVTHHLPRNACEDRAALFSLHQPVEKQETYDIDVLSGSFAGTQRIPTFKDSKVCHGLSGISHQPS